MIQVERMFQVLCSPLSVAASTIDSFDVFNILEPIDFPLLREGAAPLWINQDAAGKGCDSTEAIRLLPPHTAG
jgi:hypothetical protein